MVILAEGGQVPWSSQVQQDVTFQLGRLEAARLVVAEDRLDDALGFDIIGKSGASCFARPGSKFSDVDVVRSLEGVQRSRDARQLPPSKCDSHNTHTHQAQREPDAHHFAEVPSYSRDDGELKETRTPINHLKEVVGGRGGRAPRVSNPDLGYHLISPEHLAAIASKTPLRVGEKGALA